MPLAFPTSPDDCLDALKAGLRPLRTFRTTAAGRTPDPVSFRWPHRVHVAGLADLAAGRALREASAAAGWRYLILQPTGVQVAEVAPPSPEAGGPSRSTFSHLGDGAPAQRLLELASAHAGRETFEPRLLRVPALHLVGVWLRHRDPASDVVLFAPPIDPSRGLRPEQPYGIDQVQRTLQALAHEELQLRHGASPTN